MIQSTSLEAYYSILPDLSSMQNTIYNIIKLYPGVSNSDISHIANISINRVTPRIKELRDYSIVFFSHYKKDRITHRRVMCWKVV